MLKIFPVLAILGIILVSGCTSQPVPPAPAGGLTLQQADQAFDQEIAGIGEAGDIDIDADLMEGLQ